MGIIQEFFDFVMDGFGPDVIPLGCQMQKILHDFFADGLVGFEEFVTDVLVMNRTAGKFRDQIVDGGNFFAVGIGGILATGEVRDMVFLLDPMPEPRVRW